MLFDVQGLPAIGCVASAGFFRGFIATTLYIAKPITSAVLEKSAAIWRRSARLAFLVGACDWISAERAKRKFLATICAHCRVSLLPGVSRSSMTSGASLSNASIKPKSTSKRAMQA